MFYKELKYLNDILIKNDVKTITIFNVDNWIDFWFKIFKKKSKLYLKNAQRIIDEVMNKYKKWEGYSTIPNDSSKNIDYQPFISTSFNDFKNKKIENMNDKLKKEEKDEKDIKSQEILNYPKPYKIRGFEVVNEQFIKNNNVETKLPTRGSEKSAGYDFYSKETVNILPGKSHLFWSDIKAYMLPGEVLEMYVRSSIGIKKDLILKNLVGIIDQDYYKNLSNDGNIGIALYNIGDKEQTIEIGERIAQGIFKRFLEADGIVSEEKRNGGIGSTN